MPLFRRSSSLPDAVRRTLDLPPADKVLAAAELTDGAWAVATRDLLLVSGTTVLRRPWCDVDRAGFDPEAAVVTVEWVDAASPLLLHLADPSRTALPPTLRERVTWSVVLSETVHLPGGRSARVAVRRSPDGGLFSQALAGAGVDLDDPRVAPLVDAAEERVRGASGLPL